MIEIGKRTAVRVPATSANLGPGFDTLGLALGFWDELSAEVIDGPTVVEITGEGANSVARDGNNLVAKTAIDVLARYGESVPGLRIIAHNRIPHSRGMGSSAAAIVSGILLAAGLLRGVVDLSEQEMLNIATELEGHPDNVAPALLGGLTIAWMENGLPQAKRLLVHRGVQPLLLVPSFRVSTSHARSLQPESVPYGDAVFNVSRSALLIAALTQSPDMLFEATADKLHQDYRQAAMPETYALVTKLREQGFPAVVSGAGPTVLVLANGSEQRLQASDFAERTVPAWQRFGLGIDINGAKIESRS